MRVERIHDGFIKHHIEGFPFQAAIHEFHGPEGGYPHDHPWSFASVVLSGWYIEHRWRVRPGGLWTVVEYKYEPGEMIYGLANDIHSIVETAPEGCYTMCQYGERVQEPSFYKFVNGVLVGKRTVDHRHELDAL